MSGVLTIDLEALRGNAEILQGRLAPACRMGAAVKANGYGLGVDQVASALYGAGVRDFFVATIDEGTALRDILKDQAEKCSIYTLNGYCEESGITPVLNTLEDIQKASVAREEQDIVIHFDTGMNRLGLGADDAQALIENPEYLEGMTPKMIMSHFVEADDADSSLTEKQYDVFAGIAEHFPSAQKSLANSSGIMRDSRYHFDLARPGMALYGLNPTPEQANPMNDVVRLEVPVLQTRMAKSGETSGYNATYSFEKDTPLATVALGYADGFLRSLSNVLNLYWNGVACPIRGRVSMDLVIIDLSAVPENDRPGQGDMIEVIGPNQSPEQIADAAGTIGYEILTSLGPRYRRVYLNPS